MLGDVRKCAEIPGNTRKRKETLRNGRKARSSGEERKGARRSEEERGGARRCEEERREARRSEEERDGRTEERGGARKSKEPRVWTGHALFEGARSIHFGHLQESFWIVLGTEIRNRQRLKVPSVTFHFVNSFFTRIPL